MTRASGAASAAGLLLVLGAATAAVARTVSFSGEDWTVKTSHGKVGPGPNYFSDSTANVWVDAAGKLHLKITKSGKRFVCAEVIGPRALGYGSYRFEIESDLAALDRNVVLGLFTWSDAPAENHRELDVEFARWGSATNVPGQYVVQPYTDARNIYRFDWPLGILDSSHAFRWAAGRVDFESAVPGATLRAWTGTHLVPTPGDERPRMNLWLYGGRRPANGREAEVVVRSFAFAPAP
jgi:hypothetical protein